MFLNNANLYLETMHRMYYKIKIPPLSIIFAVRKSKTKGKLDDTHVATESQRGTQS